MPRRRSGKKIDFVHWTGFAGQTFAFSAGTDADISNVAEHEPSTLMRTRGSLLAYIDGLQAPSGLASFGVGLILVPEGTGTTVLWSPIADSDAPWIWVDYFALGYEEMVTDAVDVPGITSYRSVIDSKAMRIMRNQEIQLVYENVTRGSAVSANIIVEGRILAGK